MTKLSRRTRLISITLLGFLCLFSNCSDAVQTCILKGVIVGHPCDSILLLKGPELNEFIAIKIPVINETFIYELNFDEAEAYMLMFPDETFNPTIFFPYNGEIELTLHSFERLTENEIRGGELNEEYYDIYNDFIQNFYEKCQPYNDSIGVLIQQGEYYSEPMNFLTKKVNEADSTVDITQIKEQIVELQKKKLHLTTEAQRLSDKSFKVMEEISAWRYDYKSFDYSEIAYYWFIQNIFEESRRGLTNLQDYRKQYQIFQRKHPKHRYNTIVSDLLEGLGSIHIGGRFIDFTLPNLDGDFVNLSSIIEGKMALLVLWTTWCGPCISNARTMIPLYEEYSREKFVVIGVAGESNNTKALKNRLEKEKFPWENLVELNGEHGIWNKYGVSNSGGGTFLVNKDGEIIAIEPTVDEVREFIEKEK